MNEAPLETPVRWLLREIEAHLTPLAYSDLLNHFEAHKRRYDRAALLRHTRRELALFEHNIKAHSPRSERYEQYKRKIAHRKEKIARLEAEDDSDNIH